MNDNQLDQLLYALENPTRRKILAKLATETHYPLQLSKELNISQQAIMKHLKVLEKLNLVESFEEKSDIGGPPRKSYRPTKSYSIKIDIGPNTFNVDMDTFDSADINKDFRKLEKKFKSITSISNIEDRLNNLTNYLNDINRDLETLDDRRNQLLYLRQSGIREANDLIPQLCNNYVERRVLYYVINKSDFSLSTISETLDMREKVVEELLNRLLKRNILFDFEDDFF
jgi:predicted transcriptional regulator